MYKLNASKYFIQNTSIPQKWKTALMSDVEFISAECPEGLQQIILFGSLARSSVTYKSDIDLCLVFEDSVDLRGKNYMIFRGLLMGNTLCPETDIVMCTESLLSNSNEKLFKNIRKEGILLFPIK